ncbi:MAG: RNA polymerase sigma factor region1.1 domain-containing protein, partial [Actinomycetes bacterium]
MSHGGAVSTPFTSEGGPTVDFAALLLLGRERGYLTPDDVMAVLEAVELTPALIDAVVGRVRAEGIAWRDDGDLGDGVDETLGLGGDAPAATPAAPPLPPADPGPASGGPSQAETSGALAKLADG